VLNSIPSTFNLSEAFKLGEDIEDETYCFRGMNMYWGPHYYCFARVESYDHY